MFWIMGTPYASVFPEPKMIAKNIKEMKAGMLTDCSGKEIALSINLFLLLLKNLFLPTQ